MDLVLLLLVLVLAGGCAVAIGDNAKAEQKVDAKTDVKNEPKVPKVGE